MIFVTLHAEYILPVTCNADTSEKCLLREQMVWMVDTTLRPLYPQARTPVPTVQDAELEAGQNLAVKKKR